MRSARMLQRPTRRPEVPKSRFEEVARPDESEGVGRALQVAFRDGYELPAEFTDALKQLDRIAF